jgi:hypothetical protein
LERHGYATFRSGKQDFSTGGHSMNAR